MSTSGGGEGGGISRATATLNAAQLGAMFATPVQVAAAPGANKALAVASWSVEFVAGTIGFDGNTAFAPLLIYGTDATAAATQTVNPFVAGNQTPVSSYAPQGGLTGVTANTSRTKYANKALMVTNLNADVVRVGPIATSSLNAGGAGYVIGDTGTFPTDFYGTDAAYVIDTVGAAGVVLTYHLTNAGSAYTPTDSPMSGAAGGSQPGIGTGFKINILTIPPADGTLYVTALYDVVTLH